ncbi:hypothetical protein AMS68_001582 [Peltaster fructicola]|uniref:Aromatic amino acid beta-eliminating lyase/threonine aldolase domain-containing protein n=1 Tax=Peltaster fructicola TaxID=286661 RepID=A0A6H0XN52_9PEZI|nr:hypothetical protein AMS68_001582 [Peltaster fructicola]
MSNAITDCGDSDAIEQPLINTTHVDSKAPPSTRLCMFAAPISTFERLSQTADYVKNPQQYLINKLGQHTYDERQDLLCIAPSYQGDVYGDRGHKTHFEQHIANQLGKKHGLFFITGVQAQLIALKVHCTAANNPRVAWHVSSHLESAEEGAFEELYGLKRMTLGNDARQLPTVDEIIRTASLRESQRPAVILLEVPNRTLGCSTYTFEELQHISAACHEHGVLLHLDGARLWEIGPYYRETADKSLADVVRLFDTAYVSFYKGLAGVTGAVLVTNDSGVLNEAKMWQRRAGGNPFTMVYETIDCERGFNENIGSFSRKWKKMDDIVRAIRAAVDSYKSPEGLDIVEFWPAEPKCCQVRTIFNGYTAEQLNEARDRTESKTGIRVFEMLWSSFSLDEKLAADRAGCTLEADPFKIQHEIEWMIMSVTEKIDTAVFVKGYVTLCQELQSDERRLISSSTTS